MTENETNSSVARVGRDLSGAILRLQAMQVTGQILKALVVWCLLACFIRERMGWQMVNGIALVSGLVFLFREIPGRRWALRRLEELRPDSDFRFTTCDECQKTVWNPATFASRTLIRQTQELLDRPIPYLDLPGFGFAFRIFAASVAFTLIWSIYLPASEMGTAHLPMLLRVKLPQDRVRAGTDVPVQIFAEGRMSQPRLQVSAIETEDVGVEPASLQLQIVSGAAPSALYQAVIPRVSFNLKLTAVANISGGPRIYSPSVPLHVIHPPVLAFSSALVIPPAYTGLPAEEIRAVGTKLSVYPGTEVTLRVESNTFLSSVESRFVPGVRALRAPFKTSRRDKEIEVKGKIHSPGVLELSAVSVDGLAGDAPFRYEVDTRVDRAPSVIWITPREARMDAPSDGLIPMRWQIEDDFGVSSFQLLITTADGEQKKIDVPYLPTPAGSAPQSAAYLFEVSKYLSYAGSEIEVVAEAADNDAVNGPKAGRSTPVKIRAPTVLDVYQRLTEQGAEVGRIMERLSGESTRLLKKMTNAARTLKAEGKMAWQMEQELVAMAESTQQAKREAEKALAEMGRRTESASRQNLLSRETLQKLSAIGSMMSGLLREDYARAQQELNQALGAVRMDEKERSLQAAKFNVEQFVEQVDRTHRMLSRVSDLMAKAQAQKAVQDLVDRSQKAMDASNAENLEALGKEAAALMPKLQELARDPAFSELKKALAAQASDLPKQFEEAAEGLRESSKMTPEAAKAAAEKLKKSLADLQSAVQKGGEKSESAERQNAAEKLDSMIDGLVFSLGEMQAAHDYFLSARVQHLPEEYSRRLQKAAALDPILVHAIAEVSSAAERLILFDPRPLHLLNRALANVRTLFEQDEDPSALALRLKLAYRFTASAALQLLEISQDLQKQGGGQKGSPMQDLADLLQQLISAQSGLNSRTEMGLQLGQFGQNLEQLAFQQELIRRSMEAEAGRFSELQEKLGRIDQLLQDMRKTEDDLRKMGPTPDVQANQQKILNKLMELQQSLTDREEKEEKFEAEPFFGKMADTSSLRLDRPRVDEKEFLRILPPEYREAGKKYLRSLLGAELQ